MDAAAAAPSRPAFEARIAEMLAEAKTTAVSYMTEEKFHDVVAVLRSGKGVPTRKLTYQWLKRYKLEGDELRTIEFVTDEAGMRRSVVAARMVHLGEAFDVLSGIHAEVGHKSVLSLQAAVKRRCLAGLPASVLERFRQSCSGCLNSRRRSTTRKPKAMATARLCCAGWTLRLTDLDQADTTTLPGHSLTTVLVCAESRTGFLLAALALADRSPKTAAFRVSQALAAFCPPLHINADLGREWRTAFAAALAVYFPNAPFAVTGAAHTTKLAGSDGVVACQRFLMQLQDLQSDASAIGWASLAPRALEVLNNEDGNATAKESTNFERVFRARSARDVGFELRERVSLDLSSLQLDTPEELVSIISAHCQEKLPAGVLREMLDCISGTPPDPHAVGPAESDALALDAASSQDPADPTVALTTDSIDTFMPQTVLDLVQRDEGDAGFESEPARKKPRGAEEPSEQPRV